MKRIRLLAAACALALAATAGCSSDNKSGPSKTSSSEELIPVTIGLTYVPDVQFAAFYVADEMGYFEEQGLDVTIRHHGAQESLMGALASGDEDVVIAGGDEMLQARSNGINVYSWATLYQEYPVKILVPEDSDITDVKDLEGKKIGLPGEYGENYYALLAMMDSQGWTEKDVSIQYIGYTQAAALSSGQVDAVIGYSNSDVVAIEAQGVGVRQIEAVEGGLPLLGVGAGSLDSFRTEDNVKEKKILAALDKSVDYMRNNHEETLDITAKHVVSMADPQVRDTASQVLTNTLVLFGDGEVGRQSDRDWQEMEKFMSGAGLLESEVDVHDAYIVVRD